jgi:hypothetical protein
LRKPYTVNPTVEKRCRLQKPLFLLRILMEARVGIEAEDGTGSIEFIGLNYQ